MIRIRRALLVSVFGSSLEQVLVGGFLILTRSLLSKDWNSQFCLVPFICLHQRGRHQQVGDPDYVQSRVVKQVGNLTISDLVEMHSQRLESDRRGELNSAVEKKGFFAPAAKLLRPCTTMIISNYTVIIMCHFLLQIIPINSLNRTQEQPFDSVLVLCSALWTWTREIGAWWCCTNTRGHVWQVR